LKNKIYLTGKNNLKPKIIPDNVDEIIFKAGAIIHTDSSQTGPAVKVIGEILKMFGNTYNLKKLTNYF
jgi:hypothetical protein